MHDGVDDHPMTEAETILHKLAAVLKRVDRADAPEPAPVDRVDPPGDPSPPEADDPPSVAS
jgi:hypothetical protein